MSMWFWWSLDVALGLVGLVAGYRIVRVALRDRRVKRNRAEENRRTLAYVHEQQERDAEAEWLAVLAACEEPIFARLTYERHLADLERWNNGGAA